MIRKPTQSCTANEKLLILRFSALGDILMTVPVIEILARTYPDLDITVASRSHVGGLFASLPPNVHFKSLQFKSLRQRKTVMWLFSELASLKPDAVCDLHYVTRTILIDFLFKLRKVRVEHIDKDKKGIRSFLKMRPLVQRKSTFERYADTFARLGYPISLEGVGLAGGGGRRSGIGIAPFAAHDTKIYPLDQMERLVEMLSRNTQVWLFGAGEKESSILAGWESRYANVHNMAGKLEDMSAEVKFMSGLELMLSMDSANMHLASLAGTRVVSIWGATHPYAGFLGWRQSVDDCIQLDMDCRPCSIYGKKACGKGDCPCLKNIEPEMVYLKVSGILQSPCGT